MPNLLKDNIIKVCWFFPVLSFFIFFSANAQTAKGVKKIVIDAGHGGHDSGCRGSISNEKDVALDISLRFGEYVKKNLPDVEVIFTRKTDIFLELYHRAQIANEAKADLFICIHCNAGGPTAYGTETYVMGVHKNEANLAVAKRENASILLEDNYTKKYDGFDPSSPEAHVIFSLYQNSFLNQSIHFADNVQTEFRESLKRTDRGVKQAGFLVLYKTTMPSVLIETGFLTNNNEERYLNSDEGQDQIAFSIYKAFRNYKFKIEGRLKDVETTIIKPTIERKIEASPKYSQIEDSKPTENRGGYKLEAVNQEAANNSQGLIFRVQFLGTPNNYQINDYQFSKLDNVFKYRDGNLYKYTAGEYTTFEDAQDYQRKVRLLGYKDAFVVAFKDGVRIPTAEARNQQ